MLPDSFMTAFFQDHYARKVMRHFKESCNLERLETLLVFFPECPYIISSMAHTYYHKRREWVAYLCYQPDTYVSFSTQQNSTSARNCGIRQES